MDDAGEAIYDVLCLGLNNQTWERRGHQPILLCIDASSTPYHGGPPQWEICEQLFNTCSETDLTAKEKTVLRSTLESQSTWVIKRHSNMSATFGKS